ncbi:glycoside hydrolase [Pseudomonas sp. PCH446]
MPWRERAPEQLLSRCRCRRPEFSDYTPGRETSQAQDAEARRRRLAYPVQALGLVTGSEGGLSFYASIIAFSHGIATQPFAWMDADMRKNKRSRYYVGGIGRRKRPTCISRRSRSSRRWRAS